MRFPDIGRQDRLWHKAVPWPAYMEKACTGHCLMYARVSLLLHFVTQQTVQVSVFSGRQEQQVFPPLKSRPCDDEWPKLICTWAGFDRSAHSCPLARCEGAGPENARGEESGNQGTALLASDLCYQATLMRPCISILL